MSRLWGEGSFHAHYLSGYRLLLCVSSNRKHTLTTPDEVGGLEANADDTVCRRRCSGSATAVVPVNARHLVTASRLLLSALALALMFCEECEIYTWCQ